MTFRSLASLRTIVSVEPEYDYEFYSGGFGPRCFLHQSLILLIP